VKNGILIAFVVLYLLGILNTIGNVGKQRGPITPALATKVVIYQLVGLSGILYVLLG
jgi:hypothetical protein